MAWPAEGSLGKGLLGCDLRMRTSFLASGEWTPSDTGLLEPQNRRLMLRHKRRDSSYVRGDRAGAFLGHGQRNGQLTGPGENIWPSQGVGTPAYRTQNHTHPQSKSREARLAEWPSAQDCQASLHHLSLQRTLPRKNPASFSSRGLQRRSEWPSHLLRRLNAVVLAQWSPLKCQPPQMDLKYEPAAAGGSPNTTVHTQPGGLRLA